MKYGALTLSAVAPDRARTERVELLDSPCDVSTSFKQFGGTIIKSFTEIGPRCRRGVVVAITLA
jgi:hypothetical protein